MLSDYNKVTKKPRSCKPNKYKPNKLQKMRRGLLPQLMNQLHYFHCFSVSCIFFHPVLFEIVVMASFFMRCTLHKIKLFIKRANYNQSKLIICNQTKYNQQTSTENNLRNSLFQKTGVQNVGVPKKRKVLRIPFFGTTLRGCFRKT